MLHLIPQRNGRLAMTVVVPIVVAPALIIGLGWLIVFRLMKRSQTVVPDVSDERAAKTDQVVAVDDQGSP